MKTINFHLIFLFIFLAICLCLSECDAKKAKVSSTEDKPVRLIPVDKRVLKQVKSNDTWLILFNTPSCDLHEDAIKVAYDLVRVVKSKFRIGFMNCSKFKELCNDENVAFLPIFRLYSNSHRAGLNFKNKYSDSMATVSRLVSFVEKYAPEVAKTTVPSAGDSYVSLKNKCHIDAKSKQEVGIWGTIDPKLDIRDITDSNFQQLIIPGRKWILFWNSKSCGPCRHLVPKWKEAAQENIDKKYGYNCGNVDMVDHKLVATHFNQYSLPLTTLHYMDKTRTIGADRVAGMDGKQIAEWSSKAFQEMEDEYYLDLSRKQSQEEAAATKKVAKKKRASNKKAAKTKHDEL